jgi:hypothetical protein
LNDKHAVATSKFGNISKCVLFYTEEIMKTYIEVAARNAFRLHADFAYKEENML